MGLRGFLKPTMIRAELFFFFFRNSDWSGRTVRMDAGALCFLINVVDEI